MTAFEASTHPTNCHVAFDDVGPWRLIALIVLIFGRSGVSEVEKEVRSLSAEVRGLKESVESQSMQIKELRESIEKGKSK